MQHPPETIAAVHAERWTVMAAPRADDGAVEINARYFERFYLPKLGPTALLLARRFAHDTTERNVAVYEIDMLGSEIGTRPSHVRSSLLRLIQFRLVSLSGINGSGRFGRFAIHTHVPLVDAKHRQRLPAWLRSECAKMNAAIEDAAARAEVAS